MKSVRQKLQAKLKMVASPNVFILFSLLLVVQVSAVSVVYSTYKNRQLFSELEVLKISAQDTQVEWRQLLLEQSTLASFGRVIDVAQDELSMTVPNPEAVVVLRY